MNKKILIIGAGGHGRVVSDIALKMNRWQEIAFLDDQAVKGLLGIKVIGKVIDAFDYISDYDIFVAIGNNKIREKIQLQLQDTGAYIPILIHPSAIIGKQVELGEGTVVNAGVVINCYSKIGKGCIINTGALLDHDNVIEDFVHLSPGVNLAGTVKIGRSSWLGIGSIVSNNVKIGSSCKVGAGAVVLKDITEPGTYVGIPVRRICNG